MHLFVYGTLKRGYCRSQFLEGASFAGEAKSLPRYRMVNVGSYPGLVESEDGLSLEGEVWEVDASRLAELDVVEAVSEGEYERRAISLLPPFDQGHVEAYFYLRPIAGLPDCGTRW
jgi:gamma-glutamylaminecyclotransferase